MFISLCRLHPSKPTILIFARSHLQPHWGIINTLTSHIPLYCTMSTNTASPPVDVASLSVKSNDPRDQQLVIRQMTPDIITFSVPFVCVFKPDFYDCSDRIRPDLVFYQLVVVQLPFVSLVLPNQSSPKMPSNRILNQLLQM